MHKRGYFFLIDAIIALFVLAVGISLVVSSYSFKQPTRQLELLDVDIMAALRTPLRESGDPLCGNSGVMIVNGNITDIDNTFIQQFGEFHYRQLQGCTFCYSLVRNCTFSLFPNIAPYSMEVSIDNAFVFGMNYTEKNMSKLIIPQRDIAFGIYNQSSYGPYVVEVVTWS